MAVHQINPQGTKLTTLDPIWDRVRQEAEDIVRREPELASFIYATVLHHERLEDSVVHRIAERLDHSALSGDLIRQGFDEALRDDPRYRQCLPRRPRGGLRPRSPPPRASSIRCSISRASTRSRPIVSRTGSIKRGRKDFAAYLQSRSSSVFQTDINPAARIGRGIFLDHATGFVCGETGPSSKTTSRSCMTSTLGGTGKENEDRHPKIRHGVLIGAGAKILGNIEVGHCARIAAGSVVVKPVPHNVNGSRCAREDRRRGWMRRNRRVPWIRCSTRPGSDFHD